jgi:hypothetical protein
MLESCCFYVLRQFIVAVDIWLKHGYAIKALHHLHDRLGSVTCVTGKIRINSAIA